MARPFETNAEPFVVPMVLVPRDTLEALRLSVIATALHHRCHALRLEAMKANEALMRDGAQALTRELASTWLQQERLTPSLELAEPLAELVRKSNEALDGINTLLERPLRNAAEGGEASVADQAQSLFNQLWTWSTQLEGLTEARWLRMLSDLEDVVDQARLDREATKPQLAPVGKRPADFVSQYEEVATRDQEASTDDVGGERSTDLSRLTDQVDIQLAAQQGPVEPAVHRMRTKGELADVRAHLRPPTPDRDRKEPRHGGR